MVETMLFRVRENVYVLLNVIDHSSFYGIDITNVVPEVIILK